MTYHFKSEQEAANIVLKVSNAVRYMHDRNIAVRKLSGFRRPCIVIVCHNMERGVGCSLCQIFPLAFYMLVVHEGERWMRHRVVGRGSAIAHVCVKLPLMFSLIRKAGEEGFLAHPLGVSVMSWSSYC